MKSLKKNSLILIGITILILFLVLKDDFNEIIAALLGANFFFLFLALLCQLLAIVFEALAYKKIVNSYSKDYSFGQALRMQFMTKFFNGITPFSTGGQPMQVYMLKKDGFRLTKATNIIMQNFIIYQAALVIYGLFAIAINTNFHLFKNIPVLKELIVLGFMVNTLVMLGLIIISFSSKFNHLVIKKVISFLGKLKLIKNPEKTQEAWKERIDDFHEGTTYLKKNKLLCLESFFYNIIYLTLTYVMPYFVIVALGGTGVSPITAIVSSAYILIIGSFVPIPGASGGIEYGYLKFFGCFIGGSILKASLLIWRTISYYLLMIIGAIVLNVKGRKKR